MEFQPQYTNLVSIFKETTEKFADRPMFGSKLDGEWHWLTYKEFKEQVDAFRAGLASLGITKGDRVCLISNNRVEWAISVYAIYSLAAIQVSMYFQQRPQDWKYILNDCQAKACIVATGAVAQEVKILQKDLPSLAHIINFEGSEQDEKSFSSLMKHGKSYPVSAVVPKDSDPATFQYTSGTTGNPKGVILTHHNIAANACSTRELLDPVEGERSLAFLPWAHSFGGGIEMNFMISLGASIGICDSTEKLSEYLPEVKPTLVFAVPRIWNQVFSGVQNMISAKPKLIQAIFHNGLTAKSKIREGKSISLKEKISLFLAERLIFSKIVAKMGGRLRMAISGAAAISPEVIEFMDSLGISIYEGYGLTEAAGVVSSNYPGNRRIGSVGKPIPGMRVEINQTGQGLRDDEGEIVVYGLGLGQGYHNLPEETKKTFTKDGGLLTGDLGRVDEDGYLYITGRVKEIYKLNNGKYVAPVPIEERMSLSPFISQTMIYGADSPYNVAVIVPEMENLRAWAREQGMDPEAAGFLENPKVRDLIFREIEASCGDFKGYERVKDFFLRAEEFSVESGEYTPTLKLVRRVIEANHKDWLSHVYPADVA